MDTFLGDMAETGVADSAFASYLQFLAQGMDDGTLRAALTSPCLR